MTPDQFQAYTDELVLDYYERLEVMCEESLTDPEGRGVVIVGPVGACCMRLDEHVPYGTIFSFESFAAYESWQDQGEPR